MPEDSPIADILLRDYRVCLVTIVWKTGERRTITVSNPAHLVSIGVLVQSGVSVQEVERRFAEQLVEEPKGQADVLRIAQGRSDN
jgi:hypothetical protein